MTATTTPSSTPRAAAFTDKVIVVGCSLTGYAVVRSLAPYKIPMVAMTYEKRDVAQLSRYVSEIAPGPAPEDEENFVRFLIQNADRWSGSLLVETADSAAIVLSKHKERLSRYYRIATPDWDVLRIFVEKENTYPFAEKSGIPHPRSIRLFSAADLTAISGILYPCILKPVLTQRFSAKFRAKNFEVSNEAELREKFQLCQEAGLAMILQEIIPGPDTNLYKMQGYVNSQGRLMGQFFAKKLRQHPPRFGIGRVMVSTERDPEVERWALSLMTQANYRGYFSVELKLDPRDGLLKLIEVNCRMPRNAMMATASGVNYPWLMYQDLILDDQTDIREYTVGTYWIDFWTDLYNFLARRDGKDVGLRDFLTPYVARHKVFSDWVLQDPRPFFALARQYIAAQLSETRRQPTQPIPQQITSSPEAVAEEPAIQERR